MKIPPTHSNLIYQFIASLTLCDHMGDVSNEIQAVLDILKDDVEWNDLEELRISLGMRGITTLRGTAIDGE